MSPDERRAALVAVTIPLLREHGTALTTKQVAEAAGVAEGTVFRAFATKEDLMRACAEAVFDNTSALRDLAAVDRDQPLDARLADGVGIMQGRVEQIIGLLGILAHSGAFNHLHPRGDAVSPATTDADPSPQHAHDADHDHRHDADHDHRLPPGVMRGRKMADPEVDAAFVDLIGDDADDLRLPAEDVVGILAHLTLSSAHPMFPVRSMTPAEIVSVVLDGTRRRLDHPGDR